MTMDNQERCVLLIESDINAAAFIHYALKEATDGSYAIEWVENLNAAIDRVNQGGIEAILLNLFLSDSQGVETFSKLHETDKHVPILILSDLEHEGTAKQAIKQGAQDYLLNGHIDSKSLSRAIRNVIERKLAEEVLFLEKERAQVILNSIGDAVISTDIAGNVTYLNGMAEHMTGWPLTEAKGKPFTDVFHIIDGATRDTLPNPMELAMQKNQPVHLTIDCVLIRRDGFEMPIEDSAAPIHDRDGRVNGAVIVFHDIGEARAVALKLSHLAQHDALTALPNRLLLNDRLTQTISLARRNHQQLAVLFIDLDRFKRINDTLGHLIGDKLLQSVAQRIVSCVRNSDTVSRLGGDEFVVLLADIENAHAARYNAAKITSALGEIYHIDGHDLMVTSSIGISIFPADGEDAETLLKHADEAMYQAKRSGRNNYQFFNPDLNDAIVAPPSVGQPPPDRSAHQTLTH